MPQHLSSLSVPLTGVHVCLVVSLFPWSRAVDFCRHVSSRGTPVWWCTDGYIIRCASAAVRVRTPTACVARPLVCLVLLQEPVLWRGPSMDRGHQCVRTAVDDAVLLLNYYRRLCGGVLLLHQLGVHVV